MIEESVRDIADAAIEFIEARLLAAKLKDDRNNMLRDSPCSHQVDPSLNCYQTQASMIAWCLRCRKSQPLHVQYRSTIARRTSALVKLKRLVKNHSLKAAA